MKTLYVLEQTRPPYDSGNVLAVNLPVMNYGKTDAQISEFYREVMEQVGALPGVEHVAEGFSVPWRGDQGKETSAFNLRLRVRIGVGTAKTNFAPRSAVFRRDSFQRWGFRYLKAATLQAVIARAMSAL